MAKLNGNSELTLKEKQALVKKEAIIHGESFYHYKLIARATGITDETLKAYRDDDQDFSHQLEQARTRFLSKKMKIARPEFLLERLEPELFKQRTESDLHVKELPTPILGGKSVHGDDGNKENTAA